MCFKGHKMGIILNILSILLHPSQIVYNYILNNVVFINFFDFCLYMEKLETLFFIRLSRRPDHYPAHFICTGLLCLVSLDKILSYLWCCNTYLVTAILNLNLLEKYPPGPGAASFRPAGCSPDHYEINKNIHQALLVSAQLADAII